MIDKPIQLSLVPQENVMDVWDRVSDYLKQSTDLTNGRYTVDDVLDLILQYGYMLWIAFDEDAIKGALVTFVQEYPRKRYLYLMFCGGIEGEKWMRPGIQLLQRFAADIECDGLEATGRLGWAKVFKEDGIKSRWQVFELPAMSK
jgi:hypothetical protein